MACMRHEHLLRLVGVCLSDGMQIVTPMRPLGSLKNYLKKYRQKLGARDLLLYCYQIASVFYLLEKHSHFLTNIIFSFFPQTIHHFIISGNGIPIQESFSTSRFSCAKCFSEAN